MKRLLFLLALLPVAALAQPSLIGIKTNCPACVLTDKSLTLTAASGANAVKILQGAFLDLNSGTDTATLKFDGTNYVFANVGGGSAIDSPGGFANNSSSAAQGMQFSGSTTTIVGGANGANVSLTDNSGHTYALFNANAKGTITLSGGTGTHTVTAGCTPLCTDTTSALPVSCSVASTTLTATGTASDVIAYLCI